MKPVATAAIDRRRRAMRGVTSLALLLALLAWAAPHSLAAPAPEGLPAVADAVVNEASPDTNYGHAPTMRLAGTPSAVAFLSFDLGDARPSSAMLEVFVESLGPSGFAVRAVDNDEWSEGGITWNNAPSVQGFLGDSGPVVPGRIYRFDVSEAVAGDSNGRISLALVNEGAGAVAVSSREGVRAPRLYAPAPPAPTSFRVSRIASGGYRAVSPDGRVYRGGVKSVVEQSVADLEIGGGGTITFGRGTFDLGRQYLLFTDLHNIVFEGQGMRKTMLRNRTDADKDTEPFNFNGAYSVTIRDLSVAARGTPRSTSDALDFDNGNQVLVERVRVIASRARGIVFDGKNAGRRSTGNRVLDCIVQDVPGDGVQFLASSGNLVRGCVIRRTGMHGIQIAKGSPNAPQPNKQARRNRVVRNRIDDAGKDGINVNSSWHTAIRGNVITDSSRRTIRRSGIRIQSSDGVRCDDNRVVLNQASNTAPPYRQRYGLDISDPECHRTIVRANTFRKNGLARIHDAGTGTIYR